VKPAELDGLVAAQPEVVWVGGSIHGFELAEGTSKLLERRVAVRYTPATGGAPLLLSGHAWPESQERLAGTVFAHDERAGRGRVIAFAENPSFRGDWRGADRLFLNAVVQGPSAP